MNSAKSVLHVWEDSSKRSVDLNQTPQNAAFDKGLRSLKLIEEL